MPFDTNDRLIILDQIQPADTRFAGTLLNEIHSFGRHFSKDTDERWSLIDCGLTAEHWSKIMAWARTCRTSDIPHLNSRAAGLLLLLVGAAVARSLDRDEPLWHMVATSCSDDLRRAWFSNGNDYPANEIRDAVDDACSALAIRNQLDLQGKHRYWRTVQLQFGFSAKVGAARLPYWLAGYGVPESVKALLSDDDLNRSTGFRSLWKSLSTWNRDQTNVQAERALLASLWYPREDHGLIKTGLLASRDSAVSTTSRRDYEEAINSVLGVPRFRAGQFQVGLAPVLPREVLEAPQPVLTLYVEGMGMTKLVRDERGGRTLDGATLSAQPEEVLDAPTREVSVSGRAGVAFRQRFSFWPPDTDIVLFRGTAGRFITNLEGIVAEPGCPYTIVTAAAVDLSTGNSSFLACEVRSRNWKLYSFPHGLPAGLEVHIDSLCLWSPEHVIAKPTPPGFQLRVRERSVTSLDLTAAAPRGWAVDRVRFAGRMFEGDHSIVEISPVSDYLKRKAQVYASQNGARSVFDVRIERVGKTANGAVVEMEDGTWRPLGSGSLDAGVLEGRRIAVRWQSSADDPWLTLGQTPIVRDPKLLRRQHFKALGETLELRFGLMNEAVDQRADLVSSIYSTGILADVTENAGLYLLKLRHAIEAAPDLRVWVWEDGSPEPRLLERAEVEAHSDQRTLSILDLSAPAPLGWAVSLEGQWQGARFHLSPGTLGWPDMCSRWESTLTESSDWRTTAAVLRWWRFPVLMEPFRSIVRARVQQDPVSTLQAWTSLDLRPEMEIGRTEAESFLSPIRTFLWQYSPSREECRAFWATQSPCVLGSFETGRVAPPALLLLYSHPVLLARIIWEVLSIHLTEEEAAVPVIMERNLFRRVQDPAQIRKIEQKYSQLFGIAANFVERSAGIFIPGRNTRDALLEEALWELRSWNDPSPLDTAYFHENVVRPAEALFDQQPCDTDRLEIAVSRSSACCAYLVSHLLATKGVRTVND